MPPADLLFEPAPRLVLAMPENDGARVNLADEIQKIVPVGMCGQIEVLEFAKSGRVSTAGAKEKVFAVFGGSEAAAGCVRISIAHKENGVRLVAHHAQGQIVGGRVLAHHAGSDDKEPATGELHFL